MGVAGKNAMISMSCVKNDEGEGDSVQSVRVRHDGRRGGIGILADTCATQHDMQKSAFLFFLRVLGMWCICRFLGLVVVNQGDEVMRQWVPSGAWLGPLGLGLGHGQAAVAAG